MSQNGRGEDLKDISTCWGDLQQAHSGAIDNVRAAQERIVTRYGPAIHRYLRAIVHNPDEAEELFQTFALRFVRGDFHRADPGRGRFRDYLKSALVRLVYDRQRQLSRQPSPLPDDHPDPAEASPSTNLDDEFLRIWREELLNRAWTNMADLDRHRGQPLYEVLQYRANYPDLRSADIAEHFTARLGRPLGPEWARKRLHEARTLFVNLLLEEVAQTVESSAVEAIEEELIDLDLLKYCRPALDRRRTGQG
ncbi:MAG: sigma factor [Isosphaeraceae bacterium]